MKKFIMSSTIIIILLTIFFIFRSSQHLTSNQESEITTIFTNAITNEKPYSSDLSKNISQDLYESLNFIEYYPNADNIQLTFNEIDSYYKKNIVYMYYNIDIDYIKTNESIHKIKQVPIVLTIEIIDNDYKIISKQEYVSILDVPNQLK